MDMEIDFETENKRHDEGSETDSENGRQYDTESEIEQKMRFETDLESLNDTESDIGVKIENLHSKNDFHPKSDIESGYKINPKSINFQIRKWAINNNITLAAVSQLLKILLLMGHLSLPKDARTLLETPSKVEVSAIGSGQYWYRGLKEKLSQICTSIKNCPDVLHLELFIDGTPIYKSSKSEFWPIQCSIKGVVMKSFYVGIHQGPSKPISAEQFLRPLLDELKGLLGNGLLVSINGSTKTFAIKIDKFILDAPARAFLKCIIGHSGYFSCEKCTEEGVYVYKSGEKLDPNRKKSRATPTECAKCKCSNKKKGTKKGNDKCGHVCLIGTNALLRTDFSFREKVNEEHHHDSSPLEELSIDMVRDIPLDYLHLILFGIVKKLLMHWTKGTINFKTKFSVRDLTQISDKLVKAAKICPSEINRPNRSLKCLSDWKATEFRTFLLKTGPVVLQEHLSDEAYNHFLALHCAVSICCCKALLIYLPVAEQLFRYFVEKFGEIYGDENYTYSVHSLIHVTDDVERFGVLDSYSAFPGESNLGHLKKQVRGGHKPLQQVVKRIVERERFEKLCEGLEKENKEREGLHKNILRLKDIRLDSSEKNCWILTKNKDIFKIRTFSESKKTLYIHGDLLERKNLKNLYEVPIQSSNLCIFESKLEAKNMTIKLEDVFCKLYRIEISAEKSAFIPLYHFTQ